HVDRADTMIAGKGFSEPANKPLGLFLGYRCDDGHASVRPSLANDPVPQKDEAVIDVGDMGFLHIQHQFQIAFQKGAAFLADFLCLSFGPFYDHDKVVSVSAISNRRLPLPVLLRDRNRLGIGSNMELIGISAPQPQKRTSEAATALAGCCAQPATMRQRTN